MRRWLWRLVVAAGAIGLAALLASRPGRLSLTWADTEIDLPLGLAVAGLVIVLFLSWLIASAVARLLATPRELARRRLERRRLDAYRSLTDGLVAVAAGDLGGAQRHAERAELLFRRTGQPVPALTRLIAAQAALHRGDAAAAKPAFTALARQTETRFLGLRGLIVEALRANDTKTALDLLDQAAREQPKAPWVLATRLGLEAKAGDWRALAATLDRAHRVGALDPDRVREHRIALSIARSRDAASDGRPRDALTHAAAAFQQGPQSAAASLDYAERLAGTGEPAKARRVIERAWARAPHPALADCYVRLVEEARPVERLKQVERLVKARPHAPEGHLAAAAAALGARLWGEARRHLDAAGAGGTGPWSRRLCQLAADLALAEHNDEATARLWRERALAAPPDATWVCRQCAAETGRWVPVCAACQGFDTLAWTVPDRTGARPGPIGHIAIPTLEAPVMPPPG